MLVELGPGVDISSLDGVEEQLGHPRPFNVDEVRLEEDLGSLKPLTSQFHHSAIRKLWRGRNGSACTECTHTHALYDC